MDVETATTYQANKPSSHDDGQVLCVRPHGGPAVPAHERLQLLHTAARCQWPEALAPGISWASRWTATTMG